ncbi:hypothetical protein HCN44_009265 [Aphidius gifuensis]|uniref:Amine oxidase domain-containing protein n=1 Tax=Aphidius gifuensis TaxID=684658 RepID=A0A834Y6Z6_APHGI|nr:spermine oxidase-like [Aphidius gifuensis]KAF7997867.1 hypothetical protein HCN44_009265 [Aphidius gifuensis]
MMMRATFFILIVSCVAFVFCDKNAKIVIVGAGAAGTAAASKLLENGFTNVTILEAQDRIGGRVWTTKLGEYWADMGGQWVHGDINNVVFDMANPLGLVQKSTGNISFHKMYSSSGPDISKEIATKAAQIFLPEDEEIDLKSLTTGSIGEYFVNRFNEFFKAHPEIPAKQHQSILNALNLLIMTGDAANSWFDVSARAIKEYGEVGDQRVNWKDKGYSTILDILMKKIPDPSKELPVINNTIFNSQVTKINYENDGAVKLSTSNGNKYEADHVIFTCSLGVLKADFEKIFTPSLPEKKINAIKYLGFGHVAKIFLLYDEPWWELDSYFLKVFLWSDEDRAELEKDPERKWMLGLTYAIPVEHKPKLFCLWLASDYSTEMEKIPDELFKNQTIGLVNRFFGRDYNITLPNEIRRTMWNTNPNIRGTYSYHSIESDKLNAKNEDLEEPIMKNNKPIIQFAGEATEPYQYGTVHAAIKSGFREADRLMKSIK